MREPVVIDTSPVPAFGAEESLAFAIIQMRTDGMTPQKISESLGVRVPLINRTLREAAMDIRKQKLELVELHFMLHLNRTEALYERCTRILKVLMGTEDVETLRMNHREIMDTIAKMVAILHRQSLLMGLDDKGQTQPNGGRGSGTLGWLGDPYIDDSRLVAEARRLGVRIPESFDGVLEWAGKQQMTSTGSDPTSGSSST